MSYEDHSEGECDRCLKDVGRDKLRPVNFYYLDKNDRTHKDMSPLIRKEYRRQGFMVKVDSGYHQYQVCSSCFEREEKIAKEKTKRRER